MHASYNVPTRITIYGTFMLYKRISEQYVNQDILNYVRVLLPEEIVKSGLTEVIIKEPNEIHYVLPFIQQSYNQSLPW